MGRFSETVEQHHAPFLFYLDNLFNGRISAIIYIIPIGIFLFFSTKKTLNKNASLAVYLSIVILIYLLIISIAQTKLEWYDAMIYPILIINIIIILDNLVKITKGIVRCALYCCIVILTVISFVKFLNYFNELYKSNESNIKNISVYLNKEIQHMSENKVYKALVEGYDGQFDFYKKYYYTRGFNISKISFDELNSSNEMVKYITSDGDLFNKVQYIYNVEIESQNFYGLTFRITSIDHEKLDSIFNNKKIEILNNKEWLEDVKSKAIKNRVLIEEQIKDDIIYVLSNDKLINSEGQKYINDNYKLFN